MKLAGRMPFPAPVVQHTGPVERLFSIYPQISIQMLLLRNGDQIVLDRFLASDRPRMQIRMILRYRSERQSHNTASSRACFFSTRTHRTMLISYKRSRGTE